MNNYPAWLSGYIQTGKMKPEDLENQLKDRLDSDDDNKIYPSFNDDEIHRYNHSCQFCHDPRFEPGECGICKLRTCYNDCSYCDVCREDICGNCDCGHFD